MPPSKLLHLDVELVLRRQIETTRSIGDRLMNWPNINEARAALCD